MLKADLRDKGLHLSAWLFCIPSVFIGTVLAFYLGRPGGLGDAFNAVLNTPYLMAFLVPWSVVCGYVEAWLIRNKVNKMQERKGRKDGEYFKGIADSAKDRGKATRIAST